MITLRIEHVDTNDDPLDGLPTLPGFGDDETLWACVGSLPGGRTRWRRIQLSDGAPSRLADMGQP
jgi:hypothetical protein